MSQPTSARWIKYALGSQANEEHETASLTIVTESYVGG